MATVTAAFARALARAAGTPFEAEGDRRLSDAQYFAMAEAIRDRHPDPTALAFAYAEEIDLDGIGALGLALKTAPTLRGSLVRVERYFRVLTDSVAYRLEEGPGGAGFCLVQLTAPHAIHPFRNECALAAFARSMRLMTPGLSLAEVSFRHPCPTDPARYAAFFGAPVRFDAARDSIGLPPGALDLPNRLGDGALSRFLGAQLDTELPRLGADSDGLESRLRIHLVEALSAGLPRAADVAHQMAMSERTLFRRLSEQGLTYQGVLAEAQRALAERLLTESGHSIAEIAFLTGFSEQSTFSRAFKRWAGRSPAAWRREARAA